MRFRDLLAPGGRVLVGFSLNGAPPRSRVYPAEEFVADAEAAGLAVESRFATFDLRPFDPDGDFAVFVLRSRWSRRAGQARHETLQPTQRRLTGPRDGCVATSRPAGCG